MPPFRTTVSHCFAVNGNIFAPEIRGVHEVMRCYTRCLEEIKFHGPSGLAPIIEFCCNIASEREVTQDNQFYFIIVIFSNGRISDPEATIDALVAMSFLPVSVVFVGIAGDIPEGEGEEWAPDFSQLEKFDGDNQSLIDQDGRSAKRDCIQFVDFTKNHKDADFAKELMAEIPKQIKDFFEEKNIIPMNADVTSMGKSGVAKVNRRDFEIAKKKHRA